MKFYDRENERHVLDEVLQQSRHEARMTVLMGRRRIAREAGCTNSWHTKYFF